jgi:mannose-6-phosphate isomerase-like protein (cupin superfamily)
MPLKYPLVNVSEDLKNSNFLTPISKYQGSSTTAFYSILEPGKPSKVYKHNNCDVISILLKGSGVFGIGQKNVSAEPGDCGYVTKGTKHFFYNTSQEFAIVVGFFLGVEDIIQAGIEVTKQINNSEFKITNDRKKINPIDGTILNINDVIPEKMDEKEGWQITDFRIPISAKNGSPSTLFRARFMPGAVHKKHRHNNSDEIYYIISGHGIAGAGSDRVEVLEGHFHFIPKGVEHWLYNLSDTDPIEVVGAYCDAGSVADTGYVYTGDVTSKDLDERTI